MPATGSTSRGKASLKGNLRQAIAHHQAGRLREAERLYRAILRLQPTQSDANHNLGLVEIERDRVDAALPLFRAALEARPEHGPYWLSYIEALIRAGLTDPARQVLAQGIGQGLQGPAVTALAERLQPSGPTPEAIDALVQLCASERFPEAEAAALAFTASFPALGLGWKALGAAVKEQGRSEEALPFMRKAADLQPDDAEAQVNLALTLYGLGQPAEAEPHYRRALEIQPDDPKIHYNLGITLQALDRPDEAEASYRTALDLKPDFAEVHASLGLILRGQGRWAESEASSRVAVTLRPDLFAAHNNLGIALQNLQRSVAAEASYRAALAIRPDLAEIHGNLGAALRDQGRWDEAEASFRAALALKPDYAAAYSNMANAFRSQWRWAEAEAAYRQALAIQPDFAEAHNNLANTLKDQGRWAEAEASYRRALTIRPHFPEAHSNLLFALNHTAGCEDPALMADACAFGRVVSEMSRPRFEGWTCAPEPERLRVGLVSGDLRTHPVGHFLEAILAQVDPSRIELVAFPTHPHVDDLTARLRRHLAGWTPLLGYDDKAAATLIHAQGVHVLLDLSGHTSLNRLPVFAYKPAPVQATWLGYFATTGVAEIDYLLGDPYVTPPEDDARFTERVWRLPETYLCFTPPDVPVAVGDLPAASGQGVTFGCFNNLAKMTDEVVSVWARVLHAVPGSRLFLKTRQLNDATARDRVSERFAGHGIAADRLVLEDSAPRPELLAAYQRVDIALDPFPYPGGTTSVEALWMGVPVLTRRGDRFLSRVGESVAHNSGQGEWIAVDDDDYVAKAVAYTSDLPGLAALRADLRPRVLASRLFDATRFARNFEAALWGMWQGREHTALGHIKAATE